MLFHVPIKSPLSTQTRSFTCFLEALDFAEETGAGAVWFVEGNIIIRTRVVPSIPAERRGRLPVYAGEDFPTEER
jgi:hypothetical protein